MMAIRVLFALLLATRGGAFGPLCPPALASRANKATSSWLFSSELDNVEQEVSSASELRKAGERITTQTRKLQIEYEERLKALDKEMAGPKRKKLYVKFANEYWRFYIRTGLLETRLKKLKYETDAELQGPVESLYKLAEQIFNDELDKEKFQECIGQYGFRLIDYEKDTEVSIWGEFKVVFTIDTNGDEASDEPVDLMDQL